MKLRAFIAIASGIVAIAATTGCSSSPEMTPQAPPTVPDVVVVPPEQATLLETSKTNLATSDPASFANDFVNVTQWLNSPALTLEELKGKVV